MTEVRLPTKEAIEEASQAHDASRGQVFVKSATSLAAIALLDACGGGGGSGGSPGSTSSSAPPATPISVSQIEAARFLSQASLAATDQDIQYVVNYGKEAWINQQVTLSSSTTRVSWLNNAGYSDVANMNSDTGLNNVLWHHLIAEQNPFVQRIALFWSEFFVVSVLGLPVSWRQYMAASYMDTLEKYALGNFRDLLQAVTLSPAMGEYLSLAGSQKSDTATNRHPDENYAREVMQLFTIGLYKLNQDGSAVMGSNGQPAPTYTQNDVTGIAAAFTGWNFTGSNSNIAYATTPMTMTEAVHQSSTSNAFLGTSIPAGTTGAQSLQLILDTLFNHANTAPFVSKQMIQRLVSSNPSSGYVSRVAQVFANNGKGVRGDLLAVTKAILLDPEASQPVSSSVGKVREPMLRLVQWARTFQVGSATGAWNIGDMSDPGFRLGQSPMRSPTVFNYFSPNYTPPNSPLSSQNLVAPELQIIDETSIAGYLNYLQQFIASGISDAVPNYANELAIGGNVPQLVARLNLLLAANQLSASTISTITNALNTMSSSSNSAKLNQIYAAIFLVMASPDYLVIR
jgi:uncharacterized protein (DUF1800 family)